MAKHKKPVSGCQVAGIFEALAKPWALHILWVLSTKGEMRFGALKREVEGISARMLTERLRGLEEDGFVYRDYKPTIPPEVSYGITPKMQDIHELLKGFHALADKWGKK